ncbi:MAG: HAMP domain-containing histidine kinase, partial [Chloroflexi bacterium]|nr:HAMP domain-containing histidine kinase [Chloroflexota bacterium]
MSERGWRQAGLAVRLTTVYVALLAVALIALGVFLYVALARSLDGSTFALLGGEARSVGWVLQTGVASGEPLAQAAKVATDNAAAPGVGVTVFDPTGQVAAQSGGRPPAPAPPSAGLAAVLGGTNQWTETVDGPAGRTAVLLTPVLSGGPPPAPAAARNPLPGLLPVPKPKAPPRTVLGYVQLSMPTAETDATLHIVLLLLIVGVSLVLLVAAFAGPRLTRLGLRPLRSLAVASHQLGQGDLAARVPEPASRDEVGELARAFNDMAEGLEVAFAAQRAFVADASHELRTPLTALGGQLDVLPRALQSEPTEAERLASAMRREVTRLSRLVEELLALARLDAQGSTALCLALVDLTAVAQDVY